MYIYICKIINYMEYIVQTYIFKFYHEKKYYIYIHSSNYFFNYLINFIILYFIFILYIYLILFNYLIISFI